MPAFLHLGQDKICLSHFLFDFAHDLQALSSKGAAILVASHSPRLSSHLVKDWTIDVIFIFKQDRVLTSRAYVAQAGAGRTPNPIG